MWQIHKSLKKTGFIKLTYKHRHRQLSKKSTLHTASETSWHLLYSVSEKKHTKMFFIILTIKLGRCWWIWYIVSWINLLQNHVNNFHLTWVISLHYLTTLLKKLQNLFHLNCCLQIRLTWIHLITQCGEYCKKRCLKYSSLIGKNWTVRTEWAKLDHVVTVAVIRQWHCR